ncbi:MAG: hypothetical protein JNM55_15250 [Anaerolineales bacterium]|nr:hypothetical protein [Anaerolineales bacterium]
MPSRNVVHDDEKLQFASRYLVYHVRMYVETLLWLQSNKDKPDGWATIRNAMIEAHLVHSRILINFICNADSHYPTDIIALDYFHDMPYIFIPLQSEFLKNQANDIGGQLVHLTTKPMPKLKSEQEWFIRETTDKLIPALQGFFIKVSETRFEKEVKSACLAHLARLNPPEIPVSLYESS